MNQNYEDRKKKKKGMGRDKYLKWFMGWECFGVEEKEEEEEVVEERGGDAAMRERWKRFLCWVLYIRMKAHVGAAFSCLTCDGCPVYK